MKSTIGTLIFVVLLFVITGTAVTYQSERIFGLKFFTSGEQQAYLLWRNLLFVVAMLGGIIMGHLYTLLSASAGDTVTKGILKTAFTHKGLWLSLLASPIIFGIVYALNEQQPNNIMAAVLAFENGFFCNAVLKKAVSRHEG